MQQLFYSLAVLACPVGMGLMMLMMMRGMRGDKGSQANPAPPAEGENRAGQVAALRAEIEQLKADQVARRSGGR